MEAKSASPIVGLSTKSDYLKCVERVEAWFQGEERRSPKNNFL